MRLKNIKGASEKIKLGKYYIDNPSDYKGSWHKLFKNNNPIYIEIGMGKGKFITEQALNNTNINYIGIEMYDSVILRAVERTNELELNNLYLIRMDARLIEDIFDKEVNLIYLNFSDPWPKKKHHKRRLTSKSFLELYENIFKDSIHIIQKTDNTGLWEYSIEEYSKNHFIIEKVVYDYNDDNNIETEYETKFRCDGLPIHYLEVRK